MNIQPTSLQSLPAAPAAPREEIPGFCTFCRSRCGSLNVIESGRLVEVKPLPSHPTGKALCPKGRAAPEIVHHARRLRMPLRRTRSKTDADPGWQEISWEEALDTIAEKLDLIARESGSEAVAFGFASPSASSISDSLPWLERFVWTYGSPNICWATELCNWHKDHAHEFTFGTGLQVPDYRNTDLIVLWGHNPANTWLAQAEAIGEGKRKGARLVAVDPRKSALAREADLWLRICPGTDGALALAAARQLIAREAYDFDFVRRWTNAPMLVRDDNAQLLRASDIGLGSGEGFVAWDGAGQAPIAIARNKAIDADIGANLDLTRTRTFTIGGKPVACRPVFALYRDAVSAYTPEYAAAITGLSVAEIDAFCDEIARAKHLCYYGWTGIGQHADATQIDRAIATLFALKGQYDAPGGNVTWPAHRAKPISRYAMLAPAQRAKALGLRQRPIGPPARGWVTGPDVYRAILDAEPYRVRALIGFGANLLVSQPGPALGQRALEQLEFHVHCDLFLNPTAEKADIVLPVSTAWEREGLRVGFEISHEAQERIQLRQAMVSPLGEGRSDMWIVAELAKRLGFGAAFHDGDFDAAWNDVLQPVGVTTGELRATPEGVRRPLQHSYRKYSDGADGACRGFATETGRVELYSEKLQRHSYPALPTLAPNPTADDAFPLVLTTAKNGNYCHGQHRDISALRRRSPMPYVDLPATFAQSRHIAEGDTVEIRTSYGRATMSARVDSDLADNVAVAEYGWWQACPDLGLAGFPATGAATANFNALVSHLAIDPVSGAPAMRSLRCDINPHGERVRPWPGFRPMRVEAVEPEADDVVSITLTAADKSVLPAFAAGQFLTVALDEAAAERGEVRSYSLCGGAAPQPTSYRIGVKRLEGGAISPRLVATLCAGDIVSVKAPAGRFLLPPTNEFPLVLIAGGIGITPFIGYLETLALQTRRPQVLLYHVVGNRRGHAFADRIAALGRQMPEFSVTTCYTRPDLGEIEGIHFDRRGRLTIGMMDDTLIARRARFYLCGPDAMMDTMRLALLQAGVPGFEIFHERFVSPRPFMPTATDTSQRVVFKRSGVALDWTARSGSLLDLAERHGVRIPTGCRVGQCESCQVRVVEGEVAHFIAPENISEGHCLTCQAVPLTGLVLDA
jgi:anaerobic selenocysteine-containing dehydrogenase/ferredoxin-NADP reductase